MLKALCEQFLFSNRVTFVSRKLIYQPLTSIVVFKNIETGMLLQMTLTGVIPKVSTDPVDLIPVLGCVTEVSLYRDSNTKVLA